MLYEIWWVWNNGDRTSSIVELTTEEADEIAERLPATSESEGWEDNGIDLLTPVSYAQFRQDFPEIWGEDFVQA